MHTCNRMFPSPLYRQQLTRTRSTYMASLRRRRRTLVNILVMWGHLSGTEISSLLFRSAHRWLWPEAWTKMMFHGFSGIAENPSLPTLFLLLDNYQDGRSPQCFIPK